MVGDYVISAALPAGLLTVELFEKQKFRIGDFGIALVAGDELALFCFLGILDVCDNTTNCGADLSSLADVQRDQARGGDGKNLLSIKTDGPYSYTTIP